MVIKRVKGDNFDTMTFQPNSFLQLNLSGMPLHIIGSLDQPAYAQLMNIQDNICVCQIILPLSFHVVPNTQIVLVPTNSVSVIQFKDLPKEYQDSVNKTTHILKEFHHWTDNKPGSTLIPLQSNGHDDREAMFTIKQNVDKGKKDLYSYYLFNALLLTNPHLQWLESKMVIGDITIDSPYTTAISIKKNDSGIERMQSMLDAAHTHAKQMTTKHQDFLAKKKTSTTWAGLVKQTSPSSPALSTTVESSPESLDVDTKKPYKKKYTKQRSEERTDKYNERGSNRRRGHRGRGTPTRGKKSP